jgi:hypothetical protein
MIVAELRDMAADIERPEHDPHEAMRHCAGSDSSFDPTSLPQTA